MTGAAIGYRSGSAVASRAGKIQRKTL